MKGLVGLFKGGQLEEFVRVTLFDNSLKITRIRNSKIVVDLPFELIDKVKAFEYLNECRQLPIELVISSNTMLCRTISPSNLTGKEMRQLANNILLGRKEQINLIAYERKFSYRSGNAAICEMKLSPITSAILQEILQFKNLISSISGWAFWVVASYFAQHPVDRLKFKMSMFTVEVGQNLEVIVMCGGKCVYHRNKSLKCTDEEAETTEALSFLKQVFSIGADDVAIYKLNEDTVSTFVASSKIDMHLLSKSGNLDTTDRVRNVGQIVKIACSVILALCLFKTISDITQTVGYARRTDEASNIVALLPPDVVDEISIWQDLREHIREKNLNFKAKLKDKVKNLNKKIQNASVSIDNETGKVDIKVLCDEGNEEN
ncbi:MAG: hypothetical protein IJ599_02715 [Alphaproteobacteria bacterium]|nr:hypothetical protein [Alphaproteobacteria bacterium]